MDRGKARLAAATFLICGAVLIVAGCNSRNRELQRAEQLQRSNPTAALQIYQSVLSVIPASDSKLISLISYHMGECYWKLQKPAEAFEAFQRAAEADERNAAAQVRLAELYVAGGALSNAIQRARLALKLNPQLTDAWAALASAYIAAGDAAPASEALQHVLAAEPQRVDTAVELADLYNREGRVAEARRVLLVATQAQKNSATPWLALGRVEEQQGNAVSAESAYRKAVAAENTTETNRRLAQFLERSSRMAEAEYVLQQLDSLHVGLPTSAADFAFTSGHPDRALQQYNEALSPDSFVRKRPTDEESKQSLARLAARKIEAQLGEVVGSGDKRPRSAEQARATLDEFRRYLDPATIAVLEAEIALAQDDLLTASLGASAAVALSPDSASAHYILGVTRMRTGDAAGAQSEWETALENDSSYIPVNIAIARLELEHQQLQLAEEHAAAVIRAEPANLEALLVYAKTLAAQHRMEAATSIANRALRINSLSGEAHLVLGVVAMQQKRPRSAAIEFQQAVMLEPKLKDIVAAHSIGVSDPPLQGRDPAELSQQGSALVDAIRASEQGDNAHAIAQYEFAISHGEVSGVAANNLAWIFAERGEQLDRALQLAQIARQQDPMNPAILDTLGVVHLRRREYTAAVEALKIATRLAAQAKPAPGSDVVAAEIQAHLAQAYRMAGEPQSAARIRTPRAFLEP